MRSKENRNEVRIVFSSYFHLFIDFSSHQFSFFAKIFKNSQTFAERNSILTGGRRTRDDDLPSPRPMLYCTDDMIRFDLWLLKMRRRLKSFLCANCSVLWLKMMWGDENFPTNLYKNSWRLTSLQKKRANFFEFSWTVKFMKFMLNLNFYVCSVCADRDIHVSTAAINLSSAFRELLLSLSKIYANPHQLHKTDCSPAKVWKKKEFNFSWKIN